MQLNQLRDKPGATGKRTRIGRGAGSGKGKTGGRGYKGQKSRSGVAIKGFEGGQMPIYRRLPKRGFNALNPKEYAVINVGRLQKAVDAGRLDAKGSIDGAALEAAGLVRARRDGIRLLASGEVTTKLTLIVDYATPAAVASIEKAGGSVTLAAPKQAEANAESDRPAKAKPAKAKKETTKDDGAGE